MSKYFGWNETIQYLTEGKTLSNIKKPSTNTKPIKPPPSPISKENNKNAKIFYSTALEKLSPLRYHISELLDIIDSHNRFVQRFEKEHLILNSERISDARKALNDVEAFFTKQNKDIL